MFFISQSNKELTVKSYGPGRIPNNGHKIHLIKQPQHVVVVGNNSIYDNFIDAYTQVNTLTFTGKLFFDATQHVDALIYELGDQAGYLLHHLKHKAVYISRSFNALNSFCLNFGTSVLEILQQAEPVVPVKIPEISINNDFTSQPISDEDVDPDSHLSFDFGWNVDSMQFPVGMIIKNQDYRVEKDGLFYDLYSGIAPNIGRFKQYIIKQDKDLRFPDFFPERDLDHCIIFTELENDNAHHILVPNIIMADEFSHMMTNIKKHGRTHLTFSGFSKGGYGVQVFMEILPEELNTPDYQAKVTKLVISPIAILNETLLFK